MLSKVYPISQKWILIGVIILVIAFSGCSQNVEPRHEYNQIWSDKDFLPSLALPYGADFTISIESLQNTGNVVDLNLSGNLIYDAIGTERLDFVMSGVMADNQDKTKIDIDCVRTSISPKTYFNCSKLTFDNTGNYQKNIFSKMFYDKTGRTFSIQNSDSFGVINSFVGLHNIYKKINDLTDFWTNEKIFKFETGTQISSWNPFVYKTSAYRLSANDNILPKLNQILDENGLNKIQKLSDLFFSGSFETNGKQKKLKIQDFGTKTNDYLCFGEMDLNNADRTCDNYKISENISLFISSDLTKILGSDDNEKKLKYDNLQNENTKKIRVKITNGYNTIDILGFVSYDDGMKFEGNFDLVFSDDGLIFDRINNNLTLSVKSKELGKDIINQIPDQSVMIEELFGGE